MAANLEYVEWEATKRALIAGTGSTGGTELIETLVVSGGAAVMTHDAVSLVRVYRNGMRLTEGGDYTRSGRTISIGVANGETVIADYRY